MSKKPVLFSLIVLCFLFGACQKELTDKDLPDFCAVTSVSVTNGFSNELTAIYTFTYDTVLRKPSGLRYQNFLKNISRTIMPTYAGDSIYLGGANFLTLDGTGKVSILNETNSLPGVENGNYYYEYDVEGRMMKKLLDKGVGDAYRTNFTCRNDTLVSFKQDIPNFQQGLSVSLAYLNTVRLKGFGEYAALEIFPELLLYMPCIKLGKWLAAPLAQATYNIAGPSSSSSTTYSNYTLTQKGWLSSFETSTVVNGRVTEKTVYNFEYQCYK